MDELFAGDGVDAQFLTSCRRAGETRPTLGNGKGSLSASAEQWWIS